MGCIIRETMQSETHSSIPTPHSSLLTPNSWLITGGAGFIGCNLIKHLLAEGVPYIRVLDNLSVGAREDLRRVCNFVELNAEEISEIENSSLITPHSSLVHLVVGDIRDATACLHAVRNTDVIVHLAANTGVGPSVENPRLDMETNVIGTLNMLEAARQNHSKRFIFASSGAPVGECQPPIHEELAPHPVSPYGASKLAGEGYCSAYFRTFGVETVCLRFGNVYGPLSSRKSSVVAKFIRQALAGGPLEIYGDGQQSRDFIYVGDLVRAITLAADLPAARGEIFQIATNRETSVRELLDMLLFVLAKCGLNNVQVRFTEPRIGDVRRNFSDTTKARLLLTWETRISIDEGIYTTVEWFLSQNGQRSKAT